jgi:hypothetical protein
MTIWEYKIEIGFPAPSGTLKSDQLLHRLNKIGEEGWELVSIFPTQPSGSKEDWFIFKRPMEIKKVKA